MTHPVIGLLAAVDPAEVTADAAAAVVETQLGHRIGVFDLDLRTTVAITRPLRRSRWASSVHNSWPTGIDVVIVDQRVDSSARTKAGLSPDTPVIETDLWTQDTPLCSLFESGLDPAALDTRRRMLGHLGLIAGPAETPRRESSDTTPVGSASFASTVGGLSATDIFLIAATSGGENLGDLVAALINGRTTGSADLMTEFDRLAQEFDALPDRDAITASTRLTRLTSEFEASHRELQDRLALLERAAAERLDAAADRERSLLARIETLELRKELESIVHDGQS